MPHLRFSSILAGFAGGAAAAGITLAASAVSALASGVYSAGESAVKAAAQFEMQSTALGVMLGSAEHGKAMMGDIQKLAVATPYGSGELAGVAQTMMGMGIAAENVVPALSRIGDIAAGDTEKLKRLSMAFGQVQAKGRLMGEEALQFAEAGVGLDAFAKAAGMSMDKFRSEMEAGRWVGAVGDNAFQALKVAAEVAWPAFKEVGGVLIGWLMSVADVKAAGVTMFQDLTVLVLKFVDIARWVGGAMLAPFAHMAKAGAMLGIVPDSFASAVKDMALVNWHSDMAGKAAERFASGMADAGKEASKTAKEVAKIAIPNGPSAVAKQASAEAQKSFDKGSPLQQYTRTTDGLRDGLMHNLINEDAFQTGLSDAFEKLAKEFGSVLETKIPESLARGSKESEMAILRAVESGRNADPMKRVEAVLKAAADSEKRTAQNTERTYQAIRKSFIKPVKIG